MTHSQHPKGQGILKKMEKQTNKLFKPWQFWLMIVLIGVIFLGLTLNIPEKKVKEIEVCEGVTIGTINANPDICYFGCIQYKGEFVPYDTLKYLEEFCEEQNKSSKQLNSVKKSRERNGK